MSKKADRPFWVLLAHLGIGDDNEYALGHVPVAVCLTREAACALGDKLSERTLEWALIDEELDWYEARVDIETRDGMTVTPVTVEDLWVVPCGLGEVLKFEWTPSFRSALPYVTFVDRAT